MEAGTPEVTSRSGRAAGRRGRVWRGAKAGSRGKDRRGRAGSRRRQRGLGRGGAAGCAAADVLGTASLRTHGVFTFPGDEVSGKWRAGEGKL